MPGESTGAASWWPYFGSLALCFALCWSMAGAPVHAEEEMVLQELPKRRKQSLSFEERQAMEAMGMRKAQAEDRRTADKLKGMDTEDAKKERVAREMEKMRKIAAKELAKDGDYGVFGSG
eukprot:TRINITY_DN37808_c0_g1_i2.p1 TRINITY_DN37808_c0_g1~~TRINITY_DN37808_c0_g1_i2.p1  ORF type:complete len:120 (-),score=37.70 TRINITY_DN37808_c0_g1_i2:276-635(-)